MTIDLSRFSEDELLALNQQIVEHLRALRQQRRFHTMARFRLGERVSFSPEPGRTLVGQIVRANIKTVTVLTELGQRWRVAPEFVVPTVEARATPASGGGTVIDLPLLSR